MRYGLATGRAVRDITADLRGVLPPAQVQHCAAITDPDALGQLMRAIHSYKGTPIVRAALQFVPLAFQRPGRVSGERRPAGISSIQSSLAFREVKLSLPVPVPDDL